MEKSDIEIILAAPGERDDLLAELYYKEKFFLQVALDDRGQLMVELPEQSDDWKYIARSVPYDTLIEALKMARTRLEQ